MKGFYRIKIAVFLFLMVLGQGCVLTKVVTVPMRATGAVLSVIPVAGNSMHDAIDASADEVDEIRI